MNDEPGSSASALQDPARAASEIGEYEPPSDTRTAERQKRGRAMFNRKRGGLLDDVIRNVDILVYAELSAVYYLDCSFIRLLLRCVIQFVLLTPKPAIFPEPPRNPPYIGAVFGANILCMVLHCWNQAPSAGEQTRGYMHGGLAMDFVGQAGPVSKFHLLALDCLVLGLQVTHLAAHVSRQRLKDEAKSSVRNTGAAEVQGNTGRNALQTIEAEERGVRLSSEQQDMEMQALNPSGTAVTPANAQQSGAEERIHEVGMSEQEPLLATTATTSSSYETHIFDAFESGQIVLADLDLWKTIKEQFWAYQKSASEPGTSSTRILRTNIASRVLGMRFATGTRLPNT